MSDTDHPTKGTKFDKGKVKFSLIPIEPLWALAKLYTLGAVKYTAWNWAKGMDWRQIYDAMERHGKKWFNRQKFDPVDKQHHLIAVAWCAFTLYVYELFGIGTDDRPAYNLKRPDTDRMDPGLKGLYEGEDEIRPESEPSVSNIMRELGKDPTPEAGDPAGSAKKPIEVTKVEA